MPIKGLTDKETLDVTLPRFPRLGKLRKGGEKTAGGYGPDLDHWRFTSDNPAIVAAFEEVYTKTPKSVKIYLPYASLEENFPTWCELWNAKGLVHRCDGETMSVWLEGDKYHRGSKPCPGGHDKNDPLNDIVGRLTFVIPELFRAGYVGYVTMETHSNHDVRTITAAIMAAWNVRQDVRGIQWDLVRHQTEISVPGYGQNAGGRSRAKKWLVQLTPSVTWAQAQIAFAEKSQALALNAGSEGMPALPAPQPPEVIDVPPLVVKTPAPAAVKAPTAAKAPAVSKTQAKAPPPASEAPKVKLPEDPPQDPGIVEGEFTEKDNFDPGMFDKPLAPAVTELEQASKVFVPAGTKKGQTLETLSPDELKKLKEWMISPKGQEALSEEVFKVVDRACDILIKSKSGKAQ